MQNELIFPQYMSVLDNEIINSLLKVEEHRIIACGIDPKDQSLMFMTNRLSVRTIIPNGKMRPMSSFPANDGKGIWIMFQGVEGVFPIEVDVAMKHSTQCTNNGDLFVNDKFICNVDFSCDI